MANISICNNVFPVAGLFSSLGLVIGSQNYNSGLFAYTLNSSLFDNGFGLGWSFFCIF